MFFRLQRAQEERTRRNPVRHYDELNPPLSSYPPLSDYTYQNSMPNHLPYYPTNLNPLGYLPNQQTLVPSTYSTEQQMNLCCGYTYPTYSTTTNNGERKSNGENGDKTENNQDGKRRNPNQRPRWKINDMCLARWNEDGEVKMKQESNQYLFLFLLILVLLCNCRQYSTSVLHCSIH